MNGKPDWFWLYRQLIILSSGLANVIPALADQIDSGTPFLVMLYPVKLARNNLVKTAEFVLHCITSS